MRSAILLAVGGLLVPALAVGQTYQTPHLSDFQTALDRANAASVSRDIAATVPGFGGDAIALQRKSGETAAALRKEGLSAASGSPISPAITASRAYVAAHAVAANTAWVRNALGVADDPMAAASTVGRAAATCAPQTRSSHPAGLYTCETGNVIRTEERSCQTFEDIARGPGPIDCRTDTYFDERTAFPGIAAFTERHRCELFAGPSGPDVRKGCGFIFDQVSRGVCAPPRATSDPMVYVTYCKVPFEATSGVTYLGRHADGCAAQRADSSCALTAAVCTSWLDRAAGLCGDEAVTFTCAGGQFVDRGLDVSACADLSATPACRQVGASCVEHARDVPDLMNALSLAPDRCLRSNLTFSCDAVAGTDSDCEVPAGCTRTARTCIDPNYDGHSPCQTYDEVYACGSEGLPLAGRAGAVCDARWVEGEAVVDAADDPDYDLPRALSAINAMKAASTSYGSSSSLTIFAGQGLKCGKTVGGLSNCCKDSGLLLDSNLAHCNAGEKMLMAEQAKKACHYVGTYCSKKSLFGCLEKKMSYCCYGSVLARIVEEAGHAQLGLGWGDAKGPSCGGFTVDRFQQIDLTQVDFGDFYDEKLGELADRDPDGTVAAITASINAMTGRGAPAK